MHDVFISYSSKDKKVADSICHSFEENGIRCWYAPRDVAPGVDWREAIMAAISTAKIFVLVYTKDSNQSRQVLNEVTAAFDSACIIIPFRVDDVQMAPALAFYLNNVHWMDAMLPPRTLKIKELTDKVKSLIDPADSLSEGVIPPVRKANRWIIPAAVLILSAILLLSIGIHLLSGAEHEESNESTGAASLDVLTDETEPTDTVPGDTAPATTAPALPFADNPAAIEAVCGSAVAIGCYANGDLVSMASGIACFEDHVIITNAHVITPVMAKDAAYPLKISGNTPGIHIEVATESGLTISITDVLALDAQKDIAILSTSGSHGLPLMETGETEALQRGEKMVGIGSRLIGQNMVIIGEFSGISASDELTYLVFSEPLSVGGSGSALLDSDGKLVGVMGLGNDTYSFAVPIDAAQELWLSYVNSH